VLGLKLLHTYIVFPLLNADTMGVSVLALALLCLSVNGVEVTPVQKVVS